MFLSPPLLALLTGSGGGAGALPDPELPYDLNPFGSLFAAVTWAILLGVNLWCLARLVRRRRCPGRPQGPGTPAEEEGGRPAAPPAAGRATPAMPTASPPPVPESRLAELEELFGDPAEVAGLFQDFLEALPARMEGIREGIAGKDPARVDQAAHALKGSCANLGAEAVRAAASAVEEHARRGDLDGAARELRRLEEALEELVAWMQARGLAPC